MNITNLFEDINGFTEFNDFKDYMEVLNTLIYDPNDSNESNELNDYQKIFILEYNYKRWMEEELDYIYIPKSFVTILCIFKKYLYKKKNTLLLSDNLINYFDQYINHKARYFNLVSKYGRRWLSNYINKKEPTNLYDLELNPINPSKYYINYIDYKERKRYVFTVNDFKKMACSNLEHSCSYDLIPEPMHIKNPYNNKLFTAIELNAINKKLYDMPFIWNMFVECKYRIKTLKQKYHYHLLPLCVPSFVEQLHDIDSIEYIQDICDVCNINYCSKCLVTERISLRCQEVKNAIIEWVKCTTFNMKMPKKYIDTIKNTYGILHCHHNRPNNIICNVNNPSSNSSNSSNFVLNIDLTIPLFCVGYKDKNERKLYIKEITRKRKEKETKQRMKNKKTYHK